MINREISWLRFNNRVLQEAADPTVPLLERIKFLGIYSNNRDEFFRVRVATLKRMLDASKKTQKLLDENIEEVLFEIQRMVIAEQHKFEKIYRTIIRKLKEENIYMINENQILPQHNSFLKDHFLEVVRPALAPIMLDETRSFPYLKDKSIYLIVKMVKWGDTEKVQHALIEVPTDICSRFIVLPKVENSYYVILLDDVIRFFLDDLFYIFEYDSIEAYTIKLTRDAELNLDSDVSRAILNKLTKELKKRKTGTPVRLVYDSEIPMDILSFLMNKINVLKGDNIIPGGRYHNFKDFMKFPKVGSSSLVYKPLKPLHKDVFSKSRTALKAINDKDILLTFPYQSYHHIIDVLREASIDPNVTKVEITLYRVSSESRIVNALINAVKNGKTVNVMVELKARFDEEANIYWAKKLEEEGANVVYGLPGLKVHSKLFLIHRKEEGKLRRYAHIGTGNFNEDTAKVYSDFSLLTANKKITNEVARIFQNYMNPTSPDTTSFKHLLVSPFTMRSGMVKLIDQEIKNSKAGKEAFIYIKLNSLVDTDMINKLYEASKAGVKVKIIVRGICRLIPKVTGKSEHIEAISIVDKYLEHGRLFVFCNNKKWLYFISSADWMTRNLDHRSEVAVPIYDKDIQQELLDIFEIQWSDNVRARELNRRQDNKYVSNEGKTKIRSQESIYKYLKQKSEKVEVRSD